MSFLVWSLVQSAFAQLVPDQEYRAGDVPVTDERLVVSGDFETEYFEYDNTDFRKLDETSDQAILDSDDRGAFAFTGASLELAYRVDDQVRFVFAAGHRGLWGDDQIGSTNIYGGFLYIPSLYAELATAPENGVVFRIGRQFYTLGGLGGGRDYVLADVLDMVRVDVPLGGIGTLELIPMNIFSTADDLAEINFVGLLGQQFPEEFQFRGDALTRRYGAVARLDGIPGPIDALAYAFYSDIGGRGTGSDLSYDGQLGNFVDNDWVANLGIRGTATFGPVRPFAHLDVSSGIDRKELVAQDVNTNGFAYGGGIVLDGRSKLEDGGVGLWGQVSYFDAFGPAYSENGLAYSHGYVGMKGQQTGGMILNRFMGWHPTAYLGRNGIASSPQNLERISGTQVIHADFGLELPVGFTAWAGWWMMSDSGLTYLNFSDLDSITPPFGYSRSQFQAESRLGQGLANELDLTLGWAFGEHVDLTATGALVSPGAFFRTEIDRVAGTALGSVDAVSPWAVSAAARVEF